LSLILAAEAVRTALLLTAIDKKLAEFAAHRILSGNDVRDFLLDLRSELTRA
jgi:hypothetical protein